MAGGAPSARRPSPITRYRLLLCFLCFLLSLLSYPSAAFAEDIEVRKAEVHLADGSYQFSADFSISPKFVVEQALAQGVPLYFVSEFVLTHPRWYWLDEVIAQSEQTVKLSYNALTRQYRITRGALFQNFSNLEDALRIIGRLSATPVPADLLMGGGDYISEKLFNKDDSYIAAVRLRLDLSQLPKPLQVNALAGSDWNLDSDWYRWVVRPAAVARDKVR